MNDAFNVPALDTPPPTAATRQEERQSAIPALYKTTHERLACELALRMDSAEEVFQRYGYTPEAAAELMESDAFSALLARVGIEIRENGLSFRMKAKAISEELLPHAFDLATDPLTSAAVRADLIKWSAKVAGNEPAPQKGEVAVGGGFQLSITFAGEKPALVVGTHTPALIEHQP
jgi:hypothetical protein